MSDPQPAFSTNDKNRHGLTVLELLVTISIIGILAALLLPALGAARESVRRVQCVDHLREVGLAMHNHHNVSKTLPAGWSIEPTRTTAVGWAVTLLPYLGQPGLAERVDAKKRLDDPWHDFAQSIQLEVMLCPSDIVEPTFMLFEDYDDGIADDEDLVTFKVEAKLASGTTTPAELLELPTANYVGIFGTIEPYDDETPDAVGDGPFVENGRVRFRDFQRGLSHTFLVGERTMAQTPSTWLGTHLLGEDAAERIVGSALEGINKPYADECDFSSRHPGGANFLWGDGHVTFVTEHVDLREYHRWARLRPTEDSSE
ncbi:DUF1559 domain-containing protein [Planctomycetes bacterium TBK1r]|uniref:DUF1559 domain-containing protein n=1 Tax=Stieleria magnilauensis TaxID=2527963 RepID=A0ABX5Y0X0_9BACT|nr:hypothetical protein TBK1r_47350 [Planctomycetes bacterium TBK1r]